MSQPRIELINIIKHYQLDFRFSHWYEHLFMAEQGLYPDSFCNILLDDARRDAEGVEKSGNWLDRGPGPDDLGAEGEPDIEIGNLIESEQQRFGIKYRDRPRNALLISGAGGGKSTCIRNICINIDKVNETQIDDPTLLIVLDNKSDCLDFREILEGEVEIYSGVNNAKYGLNGPENVAPYIWIGQFSLSLAKRICLAASRTGLTSTIASLLLIMNTGLKEQDLKDPSVSKHLTYPPLETVLKAIKRGKIANFFFSKANYVQSLIQALEGLLQDSGSLWDCCNGLDINDIIKQKKHIVLNVSTLPEYITHIIADICINQVLLRRMAENYKTDHTDVIYVLDEIELLLESDVKDDKGLNSLEKLHRLGREMGIMSIAAISGM